MRVYLFRFSDVPPEYTPVMYFRRLCSARWYRVRPRGRLDWIDWDQIATLADILQLVYVEAAHGQLCYPKTDGIGLYLDN